MVYFGFCTGGAPALFGYVLPLKGEMKVCEYESYRAQYCGLCKQLGQEYGVFSRFLLNYDLVLLALLADALSGQEGLLNAEGCFANPVYKRPMRHDTKGLSLASDGLVLLSYHKLRDNLQDEGFLKKCLYTLAYPFLHFPFQRAVARQPEVAKVLEKQMQRQRELEMRQCELIDEACDPTAQMCAALFATAAQTDEQRRILERLGLFAGQIVYLLDAAEDYEEDAKQNRYNVFLASGLSKPAAVEAAQKRCRMAAGEIALCYNLLELRQYKPILDNIFFLGLPAGIAAAGKKRTERKAGHGQIDSV
ncbi:DUF5685 family protein [Ruminococcaceae bacterium OttesenSCG-928-I18]|nr:DUF5685 family protein [Ruminococcaceae bacterium OttesenSCG-928-I18]